VPTARIEVVFMLMELDWTSDEAVRSGNGGRDDDVWMWRREGGKRGMRGVEVVCLWAEGEREAGRGSSLNRSH
jgi:hypothetical protein